MSMFTNMAMHMSYLLPIVEIDQGEPPIIDKHRKPRTVDSGRHDEERKRLHLMREELGLTLYEIVEITHLSDGTVLYNFWSGRSKAPVKTEIRALIEDNYRELQVPENMERRNKLASMSMREIVVEWARALGATPEATPDECALAVAHALGVHYLTVQRQIEEKRDRWGEVRIWTYDRRVLEKAKQYAVLRIPFSSISQGSKYERKDSSAARPTGPGEIASVHLPPGRHEDDDPNQND